jgi:myo-inositol-1(or 4)-monophosphatase
MRKLLKTKSNNYQHSRIGMHSKVSVDNALRSGLLEIAGKVREIFLQSQGQNDPGGAKILKRMDGGDPHYFIDELAELAVEDFLKCWELPVACFSEDRGLVKYCESPEWMLIIDPIDGTRPAVANFESCCFSAVAAPYKDCPKFSDIKFAIVMELKSGNYYCADSKRPGIFSSQRGIPMLSRKTDTMKMYWSTELTAHPVQQIARACGRLIDESVVLGAVFVFTSSSYSLTRIVTGQLDAHVDVGHRILKDNPALLDEFLRVGRGKIVTLFPYDIAAAAFILAKSGGVVTDAYGKPLDYVPLTTDKSMEMQCSIVAASNAELHKSIMDKISCKI